MSIAFYNQNTQEKQKHRISNHSTITTGELLAIKIALQNEIESIQKLHVKDPEMKIVIFSDSLKAINDIQNVYLKEVSSIAVEVARLTDLFPQLVTFIWIQGHAGIIGNEIAKELAAIAKNYSKVSIKVPRGINEIYENIEKIIQIEWQEKYSNADEGEWYR